MAEQVNGIGLDVDNGLFEVGATLPQAGSWSIGCDVTIEDVDASVQEVRVNDISLSGSLAIPEVSVNIDAKNDKVMDLEIGIATSGLSTGITESQIVPYDKIVKMTEFSPESINERRFASSALAAKRIYDLIKEGGAGLNEDELKAFLKRYGYVTEEYVNELLKNASNFFYLSEDGQSIGTPYNIFSEKEISANGLSVGSGGSGSGEGGGLIRTVLTSSSLGSVTSNDNFTTFNAFAIDSIYKKVKSIEEGNVSLSNYYTKSESDARFALLSSLTTVEEKIREILSWFTIDENGNLRTEFNLYSTKEISAGGFNGTGGSTGGGLISTVLGIDKFGTVTTNSNTSTFNAYAIDSLHKRIKNLEESEVDLTGYATEEWVMGRGFITASALAPYLKTSDFETWKTSSFNPVVSQVNTNKNNIAEILKWFAVDSDGNLYTTYNFYSTKEISANGLSIGSGGSGGGLISQVYGTTAFGTIAAESNSATFNAYAIDSLYKRIVSLEGKATAVSFVPALTSGKQIGTLSIDGVSTVLYGVDAYSKADADGTFLKLSGGTISNGNFNPLTIKGNSTYSGIGFVRGTNSAGYLVYEGGANWSVASENWAAGYKLIHSGNYSQYALPLSGGSLTGQLKINTANWAQQIILDTSANSSGINLSVNGALSGIIRGDASHNLKWYYSDSNDYTILHSGNYSSYAPKRDGTGASGTWGIDISGTARYLKTSSFSAVNANELTYTNCALRYISALAGSSTNLPATTSYQNAILTLSLHDNGSTAQLYFTKGVENFYYRSQHTGDWKTVAFTDSNVASATKLATARTIWGQSFDGSGNIYGTISNTYGILPNSDSAHDIGSATNQYRYVYASWFGAKTGAALSFGANNGTHIFVNSSGNVTIGSSDLAGTSAKLYVNGKIVGATFVETEEYGIGNASYGLSSGLKGLALLALKGNIFMPLGNVGIGTYEPQYKLDVNGRIKSLYSSTNTILSNGVYSYNVNNGGFVLYAGVSSTNALRIEILDNTGAWKCGAMSFDYSGNIGIGTNAPEHKLHVTGNVAAIATDTTPRSFRAINTNGAISLLSSTSRGVYDSTNSRWLIGTDGTNSFLLCGNVGIGINSPQYKLHVAGTARVSGETSIGGTLGITGVVTANSGIKVASGQALTFLDASGKEHKLTYDSTAGAFKFDGNLYATGEVSGNGLHTN